MNQLSAAVQRLEIEVRQLKSKVAELESAGSPTSVRFEETDGKHYIVTPSGRFQLATRKG